MNISRIVGLCLVTFTTLAAFAEEINQFQNNKIDNWQVSAGITVVPGQLQANASPDGNSEILSGSKGVVVIDTGRGGDHTQRLIDLVASQQKPLVAVINTHWHLDHIGGNALFKKAWPQLHIYAHPSLDTALDGFHADYRKQLQAYLPTLPEGSAEQKRYLAEMELLNLGHQLAETDPINHSITMMLGGRKLEINLSTHSVTEGDLWVFDIETGTVIAGDLVTLPVPLFDSACPEGWQQTLNVISEKNFKLLVPGHGESMQPAAFEVYRKAFNHLLSCSVAEQDTSVCVEGWFKDARSLIDPVEETYGRVLLSYYIEKFIRPDSPGRQRWCKKL